VSLYIKQTQTYEMMIIDVFGVCVSFDCAVQFGPRQFRLAVDLYSSVSVYKYHFRFLLAVVSASVSWRGRKQ